MIIETQDSRGRYRVILDAAHEALIIFDPLDGDYFFDERSNLTIRRHTFTVYIQGDPAVQECTTLGRAIDAAADALKSMRNMEIVELAKKVESEVHRTGQSVDVVAQKLGKGYGEVTGALVRAILDGKVGTDTEAERFLERREAGAAR